ncbi:MAG: T9SS type A sorting domain-containing protein, partial [Ignavibacteria bacterium]
FINKCLSGVNLPSLISLYDNMIPQYYNDSLMLRHVRNLKIESKIINSEYLSALENIDEIITNYNNPYELLYANIDKLRILGILDSNLQIGDNPSYSNFNVNKEIAKMIRADLIENKSNKIALKKYNESKLSDKKYKDNKELIFNNLYKRLQQDILEYEKTGKINKDKVITEKIIYDIISNNYVPNVPSISTKLKFLNKNQLNNITPKVYSLSQNYPNPFNPVTKINYELPKDGKVRLIIYDILGREVKTLVNDFKTAGRYTIEFNGNQLASGIYFYRIQVVDLTGRTGDFVSVKRMALIK